MDAELAALLGGEALRDREAEPGAAELLRVRQLDELVEDAGDIVGLDALALIGHRDLDVIGRPQKRFDQDRLAASELDGVRQQVQQDLSHATRVADDRFRIAVDSELERGLVLVGERPHGDEQIFDEAGKRHRLERELDLSCFDLREIENVVDELEQMVGRPVRTLEPVRLLLVERPVYMIEQNACCTR
jgi:hypothetical protein